MTYSSTYVNFDFSGNREGNIADSTKKQYSFMLEVKLVELMKSFYALFVGPKLLKRSEPGKFEVITRPPNLFRI